MGTGGAAQTRLTTISQFDGHPDWQALVPGYPRPKGALAAPRVARAGLPGMQRTDPRARPAARLRAPAIRLAQRSAHLTVGTPDANGSAATSIGSVRYAGPRRRRRACRRTPTSRSRSPSPTCGAALRSVTCAGGCPVATTRASCEVTTDMRVTDRNNASVPGGGSEAATVIDSTLAFAAPCTATAGADGATCSLEHVRERDLSGPGPSTPSAC